MNIEENNKGVLNVCPICDKPIIYISKKTNLAKCYYCNKWLEEWKQRDYKIKFTRLNRTAKKRIINDTELISKQSLIGQLSKLEKLRDQAFISFLYLTAGRVEEIVGLKRLRYIDSKFVKITVTEPIKRHQIEFKELNGEQYMVISEIPTLKRKLENNIIPLRNVPVYIRNERDFVDYIERYIKSKDMDYNTNLFKFTPALAWTICRKIKTKNGNNAFNHYFRHLRLSHLAQDYGFQSLDLQQFVNWANAIMAGKYVHLNWQTLAKKMSDVKNIDISENNE